MGTTEPTTWTRLGGGRNSRVFRVDRPGRRPVVVKEYSPDYRERGTFARETTALRLLEKHRIDSVPRLLEADEDQGIVLLTCLEGVAAGPDEGIDAFAPFVAFLDRLGAIPRDEWPGWAREASDHPLALLGQIDSRLARFPTDDPDLDAFLDGRFRPALDRFGASARAILSDLGLTDPILPDSLRILSPSDFGFHNALRRPDGSLAFLDFEFFGQDDPAKLLSDMLLHPGFSSRADQKARLEELFRNFRSDDGTFTHRFRAILPLCALKWCCIALNEFVPADSSRRDRAAAEPLPRDQVLKRQLYIAGSILDNIWQIPAASPDNHRGRP